MHEQTHVVRLYAMDVRPLYAPEIFRALYPTVSEERRAKIDRLRRQKDKCLSLGAALLLQFALREQGIGESAIVTGEHGKPYLRDDPQLYFSLSHSGDFALCAVCDGCEVGCDIEMRGEADLRVAKRFFAPEEFAQLTALPTVQAQNEHFYRLWTLKESFLKATGLGLRLPLDAFSIEFGETITVRQSVDARHYSFARSDAIPGYACAVCAADECTFAPLRIVETR